ncbi:MAG: RES domain-containing protein [Cyanobacteria bacterium]|nr:RES domain-containing protein [Cyanobacteriota bacterium]
MSPFRLGFRVCDRRHPFLWYSPGQRAGRWNRAGDEPVHYLAGTPTVAWAEWLRHQEIHDPEDLAGVAAALWAVLIPADRDNQELTAVELPMELLLVTEPEAQAARLALVDQLRQQGTQGLLAPTAALHRSDVALPCVRVTKGTQQPEQLPLPSHVILLWCAAEELPRWCCVPEGRPGPDLLPMVRRQGMVAVTDAVPIP